MTAAAALVIASAACNKNKDTSFTFSVRAEGVVEEEDLPVSVIVKDGPRDGYDLTSDVCLYDVATGRSEPVDAVLLSGGVPAASLHDVSFPDGGKRDFVVKGLAAGTYKVSVSLERNGLKQTASAVAVVSAKEVPVTPPGPTVVKVTGLTVPGSATGFQCETVSGMEYVLVDMDAYTASHPMTYTVQVTPSNADVKTVTASSDRENVARASVRNGNTLEIVPVSEGFAVVTVTSSDGNASKAFGVKTYKNGVTPPPSGDKVSDFTIPSLDPELGKLPIEGGKTYSFKPVVTPSGAVPEWVLGSSNPNVASVAVNGDNIVINGGQPGYATISVGVKDGVTKSIPVMVFKNVTITVSWDEQEPSEAQLKSKTFPCRLRFASDSNVEFPQPINFTVAMTSVVTVTGHDAQRVSHNTDVKFYGNRPASYDVTSNILIPSWQAAGRQNDFGLSITLSLQRTNPLDPALWKITWDEQFKSQDARIKTYLTSIQQ